MAKIEDTAKIAFIGGGSRFVVSILHGVLLEAEALRNRPGNVEFSLYDVVPENAERIAEYIELSARETGTPVSAKVYEEREDAVRNADATLYMPSHPDAVEESIRVADKLEMGSYQDGTAALYFLALIHHDLRKLADEMRALAPNTVFISMLNPVDALALFMEKAAHVTSIGVCTEPYQVQSHVAYYLNVPPQKVELDVFGVNHHGWTVGLRINGRDGYKTYADQISNFHTLDEFRNTSGQRGWVSAFRSVGFLTSSPYHNDCFDDSLIPNSNAVSRTDSEVFKKDVQNNAIDEALRQGRVIPEWTGHPHRGPIMYPVAGECIGKYFASFITKKEVRGIAQVTNGDAVENYSESAVLELPVKMNGSSVRPIRLGKVPGWMADSLGRGHSTQVQLGVEWLLNGNGQRLREAIFADLPTNNLGHVEEFIGLTTRALG